MNVITFKGTIADARKLFEDWKAANPHYRIIPPVSPMTVEVRRPNAPLLPDEAAWTIKVSYEEGPAN